MQSGIIEIRMNAIRDHEMRVNTIRDYGDRDEYDQGSWK